MRLAYVLALVSLVALVACDDKSKTPPAKADPGFAADARKRADDQDTTRRAAIAKAVAGEIVPREDLGECPLKKGYALERYQKPKSILPAETLAMYDVPKWDPARRDGGSDDILGPNEKDEMAAISDMGIEQEAEVKDKPGPKWFYIYGRTRPRDTFDEGSRDLVNRTLDTTKENVDYELVIAKEMLPTIKGPGELDPGIVGGWFVAYDHSKKTIVCEAKVVATSGDSVNVKHGPNDSEKMKQERRDAAMLSDLREQAIAQGVKNLVIAGPKPKLEAADEDAPRDASTDAATKRVDAGAPPRRGSGK
jgi:hypothetical protein